VKGVEEGGREGSRWGGQDGTGRDEGSPVYCSRYKQMIEDESALKARNTGRETETVAAAHADGKTGGRGVGDA